MVEEKVTESGKKPTRKRSIGRTIWSVIKWLMLFGLLCGLFAGGAGLGYVTSLIKDEPVRPREMIQQKIQENAITGFVFFNDGNQIGQLRTEEDRRPVSLKDIPQSVIDALIAIEDNRFYEHMGVDIRGLSRAVVQKVLNQSVQTGGSTLTQQLARRVFLNLDRTDSRKAKEILLSLRMERVLSKEEIIVAYLNKVPFGNGSTGYNLYGIKAAAKGIFNIDNLSKLNIAQSAYLAGLPQLPSAYSAFNGKGEINEKGIARAIERQKLVLKRMLEENKISMQQYNEALAFDIRKSIAQPREKAYATYPYLMMEAERAAAEVLVLQKNPGLTKADLRKRENNDMLQSAREQLLRGGYLVYTTIDKKIYDAMKRVSSNPNNFSPDSKTKGVEQVASLMVDHKSGAILGMIEGRDFKIEQMNFATQMLKQPGSTMKPLAAYLPALDQGLIQPASILDDAPMVLKDGSKGYHIPGNANGRYQGLVTARSALSQSLNLPALKIYIEKLGVKKALDFVQKLGITTIQPEDYYAQTGVIGGLRYGVTVEEITNAFGAIANQGVFNDAYLISKIVDSKGNIVYQHKEEPQAVVSKQSAYLMTDMMKSVITDSRGTGRRVRGEFDLYGKVEVAAKTGSTQNYADTWFIGSTPDVTMGVWVGYDKPIHVLNRDARSRSTEIWSKVMNEVNKAKPDLLQTKEFTRPDGIVSMTVSGYSGKLPNELTRLGGKFVTDIFNRKYVPKTEEDALVHMKYITYDGVNYIPQDSTPADMVAEKVVLKREKPIQELVEELKKALGHLSSSSNRRSLSAYLPEDANSDAPAKVDPRQDDGKAPSAPRDVRIAASKSDAVHITFSRNPESDVVGYRLYRSLNGGTYQQQSGTVLTGDDTRFSSYASSSQQYSFYVTAVDVGGHESIPSEIVQWGALGSGTKTEVPQPPGTNDPSESSRRNSGGQAGSHEADNGNAQEPQQSAAQAPDSPSGLKASLTDMGVKLTWKASANNPSEYYIYYSASRNGPYERIGSSASTDFELITLTPGGWYHVTAANSAGESSASSSAQVNN
ncbi:transglycosylase domain-containing protein [Paenibacillus alvei]|uniref:Transglycosylase domain-containing protein n=1 Tax=Paenibacillus alvei TaxID=44250 RepID=A0ABT4GUW2_PAEAL|nr:transglycosylase domain-containing protein [Paenibacillus alvei]EJW17490.1 penicillin-binding protein 1F [Paenibacillus alvei DSM 29]MCY9540368.1 transglycosylase domain-containing protein [Paenibacillus alvei]MCY9705863.1 transglycosylase domain-containing protein [Paenibacillus alvei]MCY9737054.1 transglycosylase domain-containing protein [Paenibacillus alvei]MCY9753442.1 transglycosylase domain-containing protein [Paenibacillus alvei]